MGSKTNARDLMKKAGVPIIPGTTEAVPDYETALKLANDEIGFPVAVKASGGGGGKGFRVALEEKDLKDAFEGAAREGEKFFGDATVYLERYLPDPRHVEVQILADKHGNTIHLGERDCSIQRRHQKLIEEAPAPHVDEEMRAKIGEASVKAAEAVNYVGAGTIEGLLQGDEWFFMEMNTRVQVEHCVTEMVTGIDIVKEGIRAAAGEELRYTQDDVELRGHAIECRINAEDASRNFAPAPGKVGSYKEPTGPGVRVDSGLEAGGEVTPTYDPMVAKLIVWDADREEATQRMLRALDEYQIEGLKTLIPFHRDAARDRGVGERRDGARPARGQGLAEAARVRARPRRGRRGRGDRRADLPGRGLGQALRRQGPRRGARRRAVATAGANGAAARQARAPSASASPAAVAEAATRSPRRCRATSGSSSSSRARPSRRASSSRSSRR